MSITPSEVLGVIRGLGIDPSGVSELSLFPQEGRVEARLMSEYNGIPGKDMATAVRRLTGEKSGEVTQIHIDHVSISYQDGDGIKFFDIQGETND